MGRHLRRMLRQVLVDREQQLLTFLTIETRRIQVKVLQSALKHPLGFYLQDHGVYD